MTLLEGLNHEYSAVMNDTNALAMWAEQRKKFVEQTNEVGPGDHVYILISDSYGAV
jgi:hypothetical protein